LGDADEVLSQYTFSFFSGFYLFLLITANELHSAGRPFGYPF
jgi:hypothetical protein